MLILWIFVFIISLFALIKGADWFVESSEKVGLALKVSPFIIGVTIVAIGTSLPELASSIAAVLKGESEIVTANVIGSNIANILLIIGLSAVAAGRLAVQRSLIDVDLPLLSAVTVLFGFIILDGKIFWQESILLIASFLIYLFYTVAQRSEIPENPLPEELVPGETIEVLPSRVERRKTKKPIEKLNFKVFIFLIIGIIFLVFGSDFLIESVVKLSEILKVGTSVISILGVAVGTSLPELMVSVRAALQKKYEIALGNIFGSNVFNCLMVLGLPALIKTLIVDNLTLNVGFPFMVVATVLLVFSGITRRISKWEGLMFLLIYVLFVIKLFGLF
ncbi:MAG: calcium/sodium antiporter [Minisyncoccia bacterium]